MSVSVTRVGGGRRGRQLASDLRRIGNTFKQRRGEAEHEAASEDRLQKVLRQVQGRAG